jgi:glutathione S-transferase
MTVPVLINDSVHPNVVPTVLTESHLICNYLATIGPVSGGLLPANMLVPPENSEERATYDWVMNWQKTIFSPRAAPVVEKLGILSRDTSRKRIASIDREFYDRDYPQLERVLDGMEKFLIENRKKNGLVPGFLCSVSLRYKPLRIYYTEIF